MVKEKAPAKKIVKEATKTEPKKKSTAYLYAVGRRKSSIARTRLIHNGKGEVIINGKDYKAYFPTPEQQQFITQPVEFTGVIGTVDFSIKVQGGGVMGQAEACRHGISRTLLLLNPDFRTILKPHGFLRRDPREKERKKPGLKRARRGPQWAKR